MTYVLAYGLASKHLIQQQCLWGSEGVFYPEEKMAFKKNARNKILEKSFWELLSNDWNRLFQAEYY